jgi:hypothetical protein
VSARRADPPSGGAPEPLLWLLSVAAALVGGLAAADIVHAKIVVTLIVSLVVAAIAVFAVSRWPSPRPELPAAEQRTQQLPAPPPAPWQTSGQATRPAPQPAPPHHDHDGGNDGTNAVVQLLPAQPEQAGSDWWQKGPVPPPQPSAGARRAPAPDLSAYLAFTQIAQCPNCGAFGLEIGQIRGGWGFRCESCAYTWAWRPGTPWPTTRVAPGRRREPRPPS